MLFRSIRGNSISAGRIGLYHNYQGQGAAAVSWSNNTVTVAANDRTGLKALVDGAWTTAVVFRGIAIAMGLCMAFFVIDVTSGYFADHGYLDPLMASWVPVFLFGPLAFSLSHRIGT